MNSKKTRVAAGLLALLAGSRVSLSQDSAAPSLPQQSVDLVESIAQSGDWLIDLDIDSYNNNGLRLPDGSAWEDEIEAHEFSIGKLIETGASRFTPAVIRLQQKALEGSGQFPSVDDLRVKLKLEGAQGAVRLWSQREHETANGPNGLLQPGNLLTLKELNYDAESGIAKISLEAVESASGIATKADIDYRGRPDIFLRATLVDLERGELASDRVKYLPVDPGTFFPTFVDPANRHIRNSFPAMLVNGPGGKEGTTHPVPPTESKSYGFRLVTEEEFRNVTASLKDDQRRYVTDVLYYKIRTFRDMSPLGVSGFRAGLYRDYNSGDYTLAFQYSLKDNCAELFRSASVRLFEHLAADLISHRATANLLSGFLTEKYGVKLPGLQLAGVGVGGDLAIHGALGSGIHADTYNANQLPEEMLRLTLTRYDPKQHKRIEPVPGSLDRLKKAEELITSYRILESPFRVVPDPFFPIDWDR